MQQIQEKICSELLLFSHEQHKPIQFSSEFVLVILTSNKRGEKCIVNIKFPLSELFYRTQAIVTALLANIPPSPIDSNFRLIFAPSILRSLNSRFLLLFHSYSFASRTCALALPHSPHIRLQLSRSGAVHSAYQRGAAIAMKLIIVSLYAIRFYMVRFIWFQSGRSLVAIALFLIVYKLACSFFCKYTTKWGSRLQFHLFFWVCWWERFFMFAFFSSSFA